MAPGTVCVLGLSLADFQDQAQWAQDPSKKQNPDFSPVVLTLQGPFAHAP